MTILKLYLLAMIVFLLLLPFFRYDQKFHLVKEIIIFIVCCKVLDEGNFLQWSLAFLVYMCAVRIVGFLLEKEHHKK